MINLLWQNWQSISTYSPTDLGGDAHFREDINWDFDVIGDEMPSSEKTSFFAVALHELGHSLGEILFLT